METQESKTKLLARMRSRLEIGDYFQFKEKAELPQDLEWKNGSEQPEIGDPESKGAVHSAILFLPFLLRSVRSVQFQQFVPGETV